MNPSSHLLFLLVTFFLGGSCSSIKTWSNIQKPVVSLVDYRVSELTLSGAELTFDVQVDNPNPLAIDLTSYSYGFEVEDHSFLNGNQTTNTQIDAHGSQIIQVPIHISYSQLFESIKTIASKDEVTYSFGAEIAVHVPILGEVSIPVKQTGTLPVVQMPQIIPKSFKVTNLTFSKADMELTINVKNPNTFGISLDQLNYNLVLNGLSSLTGQLPETVQIQRKSEQEINIPISINLLQLGINAYRTIADGNPIEYTLNGTAQIGSDLSIFKNSLFNFDKSGIVNILK